MSLANKSFRNNRTGEVITVIDAFENIAILENKQKIDVSKLLDVNLFTEEIDHSSFFDTTNIMSGIADAIKNLPTDGMLDDDSIVERISVNNGDAFTPASTESAIIQSNEADEREALARKYNIDPTQEMNSQNEKFDRMLNPEKYKNVEEPVVKIEVNRDVQGEPILSNIEKVNDPIITMFKNVKRVVDFNFNINIEDKIPRLDFIEMMEDSYNTSIIEYLADEFTNDILRDPSLIKNAIIDKINDMMKYSKGNSSELILDGKPSVIYNKELIYGEPSELKSKPKKKSASERIEKINKMENIQDIQNYIKNEKAKSVLKVANDKIKELENDKSKSVR